MSAKTNIWLVGASALVLLSAPAIAQNTTNDANVTIVKPDGPAEQAGEAIDNAADATVDATRDAAQATGDAAQDAAQATGNAARDAAQATGNAMENTGQAIENAADGTNVTVTPADRTATAEGTPVEGQIFMQNPDTFLASTLMDATVINPAGDKIGDVNDLVLTSGGEVTGVVIGVGGFLGIGEKDVAIEMGRINITQDDSGDLAFELNATKDDLKNAPEFRTRDDMDAATAAGTGMGGMSTSTSTPPATAAQ